MAKETVSEKKKSKEELILQVIHENTREWEKETYTVEEKQTEKAKKLSKFLSEMTLGKDDKDRLAQFASELSGEFVRIDKDEDIEFSALIAVVPTKADKHNYETGKVVLLVSDGAGIGADSKMGNLIPPSSKGVRPATKEEIDSVPLSQVRALMKEVTIVFSLPN